MRRAGAWYFGLAAVFIVGVANARTGVVQLQSSILNQACIIGVLLLPLAMLALAFGLRRWLLRIAAALAALALAVPSSLFVLILWTNLGMTLESGYNPAFQLLQRIDAKPYRLAIYRTDGGATTSFGIVIQQERAILPGVVLARAVFHAYPAENAEVVPKGNATFDVHVPAYDEGGYVADWPPWQVQSTRPPTPARHATITLRPWIYF